MNKEELKAQFPETYNAVFADGKKAGTVEENERITAHITMGKSHNAMDIAEEAIASGATLNNQLVLAKYLSAGKNKDAQAARQSDSDAAGAITANAAVPGSDPKTPASAEGAPDNGDLVVAAMGLTLAKKPAA